MTIVALLRETISGICAMTIDKYLTIMACPSCKEKLDKTDDDSGFVCHTCGLIYPIKAGIPVMLPDEAIKTQGQETRNKDF